MSTAIDSRQYPLAAHAKVGVANIGAGNGATITIPSGAMLLRLAVITTTAFNAGTTSTLSVGDGTTVFANAVDVATAGVETVTGAPKFYPTGGVLSITLATTGTAATAGAAHIVAEYVVYGRVNENQD